MTEIPNLICSNAAVGGNFKSTRDTKTSVSQNSNHEY